MPKTVEKTKALPKELQKFIGNTKTTEITRVPKIDLRKDLNSWFVGAFVSSDMKKGEYNGKPTESMAYRFKVEASSLPAVAALIGEMGVIYGSGHLDYLFDANNVMPGERVAITYLGKEEIEGSAVPSHRYRLIKLAPSA